MSKKKKRTKPKKKVSPARAPKPPPPAVAVQKVQICSGNGRPEAQSKPDNQPLPEDPPSPLDTLRALRVSALLSGDIATVESSLANGNLVIPFTIEFAQAEREKYDLKTVAGWLQETMRLLKIDDAARAAEGLCQITFRMVELLNQLAEKGLLGSAPSRLPAWPIIFAPGASDGASRMKDECSLFEGLKVGTDSPILTQPRSRAGIGKTVGGKVKGEWKSLALDACEAVNLNRDFYLVFSRIRRASKAIFTKEYKLLGMKTTMTVQFYRTPARRMLAWPWWMDACLTVPKKLRADSLQDYETAIDGLVRWHMVFAGQMRRLFKKVRDTDEGESANPTGYDPKSSEMVFAGVKNVLRALAGVPRRGTG